MLHTEDGGPSNSTMKKRNTPAAGRVPFLQGLMQQDSNQISDSDSSSDEHYSDGMFPWIQYIKF